MLDTSRRTVLKVIGTTAAIGLFPVYLAGCSKVDINSVGAQMMAELDHIDIAREIGATYIEQAPDLQSATYTQLLLNKLALTMSKKDLVALSARLREQVNQDFISENVVIVDGWMLSNTEATLCALASVAPDNATS
jgi:hypothetical protein